LVPNRSSFSKENGTASHALVARDLNFGPFAHFLSTGMYEIAQINLACAKAGRMNCGMGQLDDIAETPAPALEIARIGAEAGVYGLIRQDILSGRLSGNERLKVSTLAAH